jgi:arabinose-5-phosphate isomerase
VALIAVTANAQSTLAEAADVLLLLPQATEACPLGLAPTTSTLVQLALGDALAVALFESHGFTALQFRELHPGGKLGALLKFVRDIMHRGERLPIVAVGTPMSDAVLEISAKGFGCVGVVDMNGRLAGIVTDGDLRRHMGADLLRRPVEEIMTKQPVTARPDQVASEALEVMNSAKGGKGITALFVVEAGKPVGLVHMHDLLRIGVA